MFCEVYILDAPYHIDRPFDYATDGSHPRGTIVRVPFGRGDRLRTGVVVRLKDTPDSEGNIKPVHSAIAGRFSLTEEMLGLCLFLKEYTLCTFGEAVRTVLPPGALAETPNVKLRRVCNLKLSREACASLLVSTGRAGIRSEGQREIIKYLMEIGSADAELVTSLPGVSSAHIRALAEKGIIEISSFEEIRNPYARYALERDVSPIKLSPAQETAYATAEELYLDPKPRAALLYGVTGSGKTKVIMKLIDRTLADGKTVIMLVPEISLTPQTVNLFCRRYGERVAVLHSSLSQGERLDAWTYPNLPVEQIRLSQCEW